MTLNTHHDKRPRDSTSEVSSISSGLDSSQLLNVNLIKNIYIWKELKIKVGERDFKSRRYKAKMYKRKGENLK